jgi:hypothetical protein
METGDEGVFELAVGDGAVEKTCQSWPVRASSVNNGSRTQE